MSIISLVLERVLIVLSTSIMMANYVEKQLEVSTLLPCVESVDVFIQISVVFYK